MKHHTKFKGDIGLTKVIAHLTEQNIDCLLPISEHLPFDLVVMSQTGKLYKVQVKYSSFEDDKIKVNLRATRYDNTKGMYAISIDKTQIDIFAVYSPDTKNVYYVSSEEVKDYSNSFWLSVIRPTTNRKSNWHEDYLDPLRLII